MYFYLMKKYTIILFVVFSVHFNDSIGQINALTETGDKVQLFKDGTWKYTDDKTEEPNKVIKLNPIKFDRSIKNDFLVKSTRVKMGVWVNSKKWTFSKEKPEESAEYTFKYKDGDLYAMFITEELNIPLESLKKIALDNAKEAAPDIKLTHEEYRIVNGKKILTLEMTGTIQGIKFTYFGYYYTNENSTIQLITYTGEKLMQEYKDEAANLLNGLVEL